MPFYNFECKKCHHTYDDMVPYDETDKYPTVKCPKCDSKRKIKLITACNYQFSNPQNTDRWNSESGGHDYRFKHNLPKVIAERQSAEEASHMGTDIYNPINDLDSNDSWGEVK